MPDIHIEEFYSDVAKILLQLYANFPKLSTVYVEDISGPDTIDEYGLHSERHLNCFAAMLWLQQHDYIYFDETIRQEAIAQATITQKCLLLLSARTAFFLDQDTDKLAQLPSSVAQEQITNINTLRQLLKNGSSIQLNEAVHHILECAQYNN